MTNIRVRVTDRGYKRLWKKMQKIAKGNVGVEVGLMGETASYDESGVTVVQVALWAEYGIGQPERSWLRGWVEAKRPEIEIAMGETAKSVVKGTDLNVGLNRLGVTASVSMKVRIRGGIPPANAPATIAAKGSSTPLIDTAQFINSIQHKVIGA